MPTTSVKSFRELSAEEFFRICQARDRVFVLEQKITICEELDEVDLHALHITLKDGDDVVAYARCYEEGGEAHIGRVLTTVRGQGYGLEVMRIAIETCCSRFGCSRFIVHAQEQVIPFYRKLGFRECSELFDECGILHKTMELSL